MVQSHFLVSLLQGKGGRKDTHSQITWVKATVLPWYPREDIIGKIVSSCRTILVQGDDIRGGTKANACHRQFTAGTGVNGLKFMQNSMD